MYILYIFSVAIIPIILIITFCTCMSAVYDFALHTMFCDDHIEEMRTNGERQGVLLGSMCCHKTDSIPCKEMVREKITENVYF